MKKYTVEFHTTNNYGTQIATSDTLTELFNTIQNRGCDVHDSHFKKAYEWDITATEGKKYYGNTFTIVKGNSLMTAYTSF